MDEQRMWSFERTSTTGENTMKIVEMTLGFYNIT